MVSYDWRIWWVVRVIGKLLWKPIYFTYDSPFWAIEEEVIPEVTNFKEEGLVTQKDEKEKKKCWKSMVHATVNPLDQLATLGGGAPIRTALRRAMYLAHTARRFKCTAAFSVKSKLV